MTKDQETMMLILMARQVRLLEALCHVHDIENAADEMKFRDELKASSFPGSGRIISELYR